MLMGNISNFINFIVLFVYFVLYDLGLEIWDYFYCSNLFISICNGDFVYFCFDDNGQIFGLYSNVSVQWEFFDVGGLGWQLVILFFFIDFCFLVVLGELILFCSSSLDGFVD